MVGTIQLPTVSKAGVGAAGINGTVGASAPETDVDLVAGTYLLCGTYDRTVDHAHYTVSAREDCQGIERTQLPPGSRETLNALLKEGEEPVFDPVPEIVSLLTGFR